MVRQASFREEDGAAASAVCHFSTICGISKKGITSSHCTLLEISRFDFIDKLRVFGFGFRNSLEPNP
jgi:hypothetical protein